MWSNNSGRLFLAASTNQTTELGKRLAKLRKLNGFTQEELAAKVGVSRRVIAYYENESNNMPSNLIVAIVNTLKISADELLGIKPMKKTNLLDEEIWDKLKRFQKLSTKDKNFVLHYIDIALKKKN